MRKVVSLYIAGLRLTVNSVVILIATLILLVAAIFISLPQDLFSSGDVPKISLAIVYGDGYQNDDLIDNLDAELGILEVVEDVRLLSAEAAKSQLEQGDVDAVITLPKETYDVLLYGGHATVTVEANDALYGLVVYTVADKAVETLDQLQNYALIYQDAVYDHIGDPDERYQAINTFSLRLIGEAFTWLNSVENASEISPYFVQVLTILLFFMVSIGAFFVAVVVARQYATGYIRHLYTHGVRFRHLLITQLALSTTIAAILALILALIFSFVTKDVNFALLVVSAILLSLVLTVVYMMFSGFKQQPKVATTRTLIGCLAAMFFMLFAGGGFYPTALMQSDIRLFNPSWLSNQLAVWTLGGTVDVLSLAVFALPFALASAVCYLEWRRSL